MGNMGRRGEQGRRGQVPGVHGKVDGGWLGASGAASAKADAQAGMLTPRWAGVSSGELGSLRELTSEPHLLRRGA